MTFDEYREMRNNNKNIKITNTTTQNQNIINSENIIIEKDNLVYLTIDSQTYWFTKQELILTSIILILSVISIVLLITKIISNRKLNHSNTNTHSTKKICCIILISILALLLFIYFPNIFIDLIITAIAYEVVPIFLRFILKKQYAKTEAQKIAIFNTIVVFILFKIFQLIILSTFDYSYECFLWGYISFKLLYTNKKIEKIDKE